MNASDKNYLTGKRIAITGGTGFIGSHLLAKILQQKPSEVLLISRGSKTQRIKDYLSQITIKRYKSSEQYVKYIVSFKPDYLFILGGNADPRISLDDPRTDLEHNLMYNFTLLEQLQKKKNTKVNVVYVSSVAVYGENSEKLQSEISLTSPKSPYGINKLAMEGYIRFFAESANIKGFSVRLFSTYGPFLYKQVVYDFIKKLIDSPKRLVIRGDGSEVRDLSFIDDQIDGIILLAQKANYKGEVYNLGSGKGISVSDLAEKIAKIMNIKPKITYTKKNKEKHHGQIWIAQIAKIKKLKHTSKVTIDEGLRRTIDWVRQV